MIWYDLLEESQCQEQQFDRSIPPTSSLACQELNALSMEWCRSTLHGLCLRLA